IFKYTRVWHQACTETPRATISRGSRQPLLCAVRNLKRRRMIMPKRTGLLVVAALAMLAWVGEAGATLTVFNTFTGNDLVSTDGCGSNNASCTLQSNIQAGSTIQAAYLYSSTFNSATDPNGITLGTGGNST